MSSSRRSDRRSISETEYHMNPSLLTKGSYIRGELIIGNPARGSIPLDVDSRPENDMDDVDGIWNLKPSHIHSGIDYFVYSLKLHEALHRAYGTKASDAEARHIMEDNATDAAVKWFNDYHDHLARTRPYKTRTATPSSTKSTRGGSTELRTRTIYRYG